MIDLDLNQRASSLLAAVVAALLEDAAPVAVRFPAAGESEPQGLLWTGEDVVVLARAMLVLVRLAGEPA